MTHVTVKTALANLQPGQQLIYHVGSLMYDRLRGPMFQTVHGTALAVYAAYERGEITLVQRKLAPLQYEYIAIAR